MDHLAFLNQLDPTVLEELHQQYLQNPDSVEPSWRQFFAGYELASNAYPISKSKDFNHSELNVIRLINDYRERGHLFADTNPILDRVKHTPTLEIENYGLDKKHLTQQFEAGNSLGIGKATLSEIISFLQSTYCGKIGVEYEYIRIPEMRMWLREKMESTKNTPVFSKEKKLSILKDLSEAVLLEKFIHRKFIGQKRFSLEGNDSFIPALHAAIGKGSESGASEFVIGMAHRGRLNTLANVMQKPIDYIFSEFAGNEYEDLNLLGDVKYHLGFTSQITNSKGEEILLTLAPNPSHLEAVNPVLEGISRGRLDNYYHGDFSKVVPILVHGDAAMAGQGIVYEVFQMSGLPAFKTGGTIHIVTNNQIGFTTLFTDARTSTYCTDVAKTVQAPIFHVNGDDVEAVVFTMELAMDFRTKFNRDVVVDIVGYRKFGHNESDEPRFTQPVLYKIIEKHPDPLNIYTEQLIAEKTIVKEEADIISTKYLDLLEQELEKSKQIEKARIASFLVHDWKEIKKVDSRTDLMKQIDTTYFKEDLNLLAEKITTLPDEYSFFSKIKRLYNERITNYKTNQTVDWAMGELLAYSTLISEGFDIRMSGQDVERGTFSHRHAVLTDDDGKKYYPLNKISSENRFSIHNSFLSEYGVLGFEYGYSITRPDSLTIWEAQFGDFMNGAQIIIDQFITSGEEKWNVMSGLVMLLPHGFEGQGPEHSSARMERFLIQCDETNMQVLNCSTPANFYHALRRQMHSPYRKPMAVFTPKSLLRHPRCISTVKELTDGFFQEVIDDAVADAEIVTKLVFCSGKIYYELLEEKEKITANHIAIVRLEQISPIPFEKLWEIIEKYKQAKEWIWVQEEPGNMGAWTYLHRNFKDVPLRMIARPDTSSPATGSSKLHKQQQRKLIDKVFGECQCNRLKQECKMICSLREY
jgi:2-oxoglutarate dehydrogenase E1 component